METRQLIQAALKEDIGSGDHTSISIFPVEAQGTALIKAKQSGVLCGLEIAKSVFHEMDQNLQIECLMDDGELVESGSEVLYAAGSIRSILTAERTVLNFMQRLSGIATATHTIKSLIKGYKTQILDTRKTTPGWRVLEKYAVKTGGGINHRMGLYDMVMIKDNHIDFAGGIEAAIELVQKYLADNQIEIPIVVEARSLEDVKQILLKKGIKRILLDNFEPDEAAQAVKWCYGKVETEISGNINQETIRTYASTGVDYISVGAITHSFKSFDFTLLSKTKK